MLRRSSRATRARRAAPLGRLLRDCQPVNREACIDETQRDRWSEASHPPPHCTAVGLHLQHAVSHAHAVRDDYRWLFSWRHAINRVLYGKPNVQRGMPSAEMREAPSAMRWALYGESSVSTGLRLVRACLHNASVLPFCWAWAARTRSQTAAT